MVPYPGIIMSDMKTMLDRGYRMDKLRDCADEIWDVMMLCWKEDPEDRPSFMDLRGFFIHQVAASEQVKAQFGGDEETEI